MKKSGIIFLTALVSGTVAIGGYKLIENRNQVQGLQDQQRVSFVNDPVNVSSSSAGNPDFVAAAAAVTPAIVHIKTTYDAGSSMGSSGNPFEELFGGPGQNMPAMASGSGVIITADGYIITNNHVVEEASKIQVILPDKRTFPAKLIGRDPNTDLALIKVSAAGLPLVQLGNSDKVNVGEWVLAVGYPFSLNTTVTAGIISAKGRSIGILSRSGPSEDEEGAGASSAIESFLQTDAAINPGNSGGALVNSDGQLVGINSAIASQTGSYAGYGFAIPVNLAKKVVEDLIKFGTVKRGFLGVTFPSPTMEEQFLREKGIKPGTVKGVYITGVQSGSAAAEAGLKEGDIIQSIDGIKVNSSEEFSERVARHRPGDKVTLTVLRGESSRNVVTTLKGQESARLAENNTPAENNSSAKLGASFAPVTNALKQRYRITSGVVVTDITKGGFFEEIGIPKGTVISTINGKQVNNTNDVNKALVSASNGIVRIDGITPDGSRVVFNVALGT